MQAQVTKTGIFNSQVCVPRDWEDAVVKAFADSNNPAGTENGWMIEKEGHEALNGSSERVPCANREGFVHVMLEC